jgi:ribosome-binding protein aMBF1 (putative translation factor)
MATVYLTESECYDVASIIREYAKEIRRDISNVPADYPPRIKEALEQAADQREKLADRIEDVVA